MEENIDDYIVEQSSSVTSKRARKSTSIVWKDFVKLDAVVSGDGKQRAKCKWCDNIYVADPQTGTSNLLRHVKICKSAMENVARLSLPFDQDKYREMVSTAIIKHNYPFSFVEHEGIVELHKYLQPNVKPITRNTAKSDVLKMYNKEKERIKHELQSVSSMVCLTSDLWSSLSTDGYLALTAHYVDDNWILQKRILSFRHVPPPHSGPILADRVISLLREWGIEKKIFSLTLDNASYNDRLVDMLKSHMSITSKLLCNGEFFHIRCGAHVLNLIVHDSLKVIDDCVDKVRESVKYVRGTEGRKIEFADCISQLSIKCSKRVRQDVTTRWNSTYLMIESASIYKRAFSQLKLLDSNFRTCPSEEEWIKVERVARFLKSFYDITTLFSGCQYPTANLYFHGVWKIQMLITEEMSNSDGFLYSMAERMKAKFDKYWEHYSVVLSIAVVLDPRFKLQFIEFCFSKLHGSTYQEKVRLVREKMYLLYDEYVRLSPSVVASNPSEGPCALGGNDNGEGDELDEFDSFESQHYGLNINKSQLDLYLEEQRIDRKEDLDVLNYWKVNKSRFPELALMARDVLSIPITSVASESAFSIGGQIIDKHRSSILPKNAEALVCTKDWLRDKKASDDSEDEDPGEDFGDAVAESTQD